MKAPAVAAVMPDGGRLQLCEKNEESSTHWHEYKGACLLELGSQTHEADPCLDVPVVFLQRDHIRTLTRDMGKKAADAALPPDAEPFVPILNFIHALTYVYASASAGRSEHEGWAIFVRWMTWVWRGEVSRVIVELARKRCEVGWPWSCCVRRSSHPSWRAPGVP